MGSNPLKFDGEGVDLFMLFLKNLVLSILTLGIYSFWGNVEQIKYVYQHTSFQGQRFEYTATGKEKFIAFLKVLGLLIVVMLAIGLLSQVVGPIVFILFYLGIIGIIPMIQYGARHYMLSRSKLYNIPFSLQGDNMEFTKLTWKMIFITLITFGIAAPWLIVAQQKYLMNHTKYGQLEFAFDGEGNDLFVTLLLGNLLSAVTLGIYLPWFLENLREFDLNHTTFDGERVRYNKSGLDFLILIIVNLLIIVFTLGFGTPWVMIRVIKYVTERIEYSKQIDFTTVYNTQSNKSSAFGEEAMAFLQ